MQTDQFFQIGQVLKSNGTDGQLVISFRGKDADEISEKEPVFIFFDELPVPYFLSKIQQRGSNKVLAYLTDTVNLEDAEELVGRGIYMRDEGFEQDGLEDFTGWTLCLAGDNTRSYTISGIEDIPGNPCLVVECGDNQILVPFHEDLVTQINEETQVITMDLPEGLLDL